MDSCEIKAFSSHNKPQFVSNRHLWSRPHVKLYFASKNDGPISHLIFEQLYPVNSPFNSVCVGAAAQFDWFTTQLLENDIRNHSRPTRALPLPRNAFVAVSPRFPSKNDGAISSQTPTKTSQMRAKLMQLSKTAAAQQKYLLFFELLT